MKTRTKLVLTHAELKRQLKYHPKTGRWTWKITKANGCVRPGRVAGTRRKNDQRWQLSIDGALFLGSRLAWFYMTKTWPSKEIDHEDTNVTNDKWNNLRLATSAQNKWNTKRFKTNKTGFKGVMQWHRKFKAQISIDRTTQYLGLFDTALAASLAYTKAAKQLRGNFARVC